MSQKLTKTNIEIARYFQRRKEHLNAAHWFRIASMEEGLGKQERTYREKRARINDKRVPA